MAKIVRPEGSQTRPLGRLMEVPAAELVGAEDRAGDGCEQQVVASDSENVHMIVEGSQSLAGKRNLPVAGLGLERAEFRSAVVQDEVLGDLDNCPA